MEDEAIILDYLATGRPDDTRSRGPLAYAVGVKEFALFSLVPREGVSLSPGDKVYIGKEIEQRKHVDRVRERVQHDQLTHAAQAELPFQLAKLIGESEPHFLRFFNETGAISVRMHVLELLPGLGKRLMQQILEERKKKPFESLKDLTDRVKAVHDPVKLLVARIEEELKDPEIKYRLFTRPPRADEPGHGYHGHGHGHRH